MNKETERIKSDLEKRLEAEGWSWLTNTASYSFRKWKNPEEFLGREPRKSIVNGYGRENVRICDEAYGINGRLLQGFCGIYIRTKILMEKQKLMENEQRTNRKN